ncbi:MAG: DUF1385 domain-containing protein [Dehalococcoidales bacterium]|nr:MAG: DUF1385 domain-containing protein [Dehalococcoidales bacterium]
MAERFYYGGQAVVEGVMMRGQDTCVTAVRRTDGEIVVESQILPKIYKGKMRKTPFVRGIIVLIESMVLGIQSIIRSANLALEEENEEISGWMLWLMVAGSIAFAVVLFFLAPLFITKLFNIESSFLFNLVDGLIRIAILVTYLGVMGFLPELKKVFAYHGAEHKTVNAYENGVPMETEDVKKFSTAHVRCGTSFTFTVLIIAVLVFSLVGIHQTWMMVLSRIVLIPVISSISYEAIYFSGRHTDNWLVKILSKPGLLLQSLTTREPDEAKIEVAVSALRKVIEKEQPELVTWEVEKVELTEETSETAAPETATDGL